MVDADRSLAWLTRIARVRDGRSALARSPQVGRKLLPQDWNRKLQAVQAKAAEAANDLPPGFLSQFDGGLPCKTLPSHAPRAAPATLPHRDGAPPALGTSLWLQAATARRWITSSRRKSWAS